MIYVLTEQNFIAEQTKNNFASICLCSKAVDLFSAGGSDFLILSNIKSQKLKMAIK